MRSGIGCMQLPAGAGNPGASAPAAEDVCAARDDRRAVCCVLCVACVSECASRRACAVSSELLLRRWTADAYYSGLRS